MAVIAHQNENIDSLLKRLHREVMREKILETFRDRVYFVHKSRQGVEQRREWAKQKRRRRAAARRSR